MLDSLLIILICANISEDQEAIWKIPKIFLTIHYN